VLQGLAASKLPADRLELEIAEAILMQDHHNALAFLHQLRQLGVHIVMNDFASGYGSLSYLRSFPFAKVKIGGDLIAAAARALDAAALVEAVVGLAGKLGMTTLADAIESAPQCNWLRSHGCTEAQGYFFGPPIPAHSIEEALAVDAARQAT
jgi:EAL domain-containing protein (putative c-di-GMP-specific phosphodiesterase class I)